mmetsp:Transcript_68150/g.61263  ORF Transcript_68150/g.61263 Transcript_68150/m.61263 type:complete len:126 (+) Transcript_68150:31-408(+)
MSLTGVVTHSHFQKSHTLKQRIKISTQIMKKYPNRIPVICEKAHQRTVMDLDKTKYLVPRDLTMGQFVYVIRKRIKLRPEEAIFVFTMHANTLPSTPTLLSQIYKDYKDEDGFLYFTVGCQETFG